MKHKGRMGIVWRKQFLPGEILAGITIWERLEFIDRWRGARRHALSP